MRLLITGGCGFIGSHVCSCLVSSPHQTLVIDNLSSGSLDRVRDFLDLDSNKFQAGDIRDQEFVTRILQDFRPEAVLHLAAPTSVPESKVNPHLYFDTIVNGTYNIVKASKIAGVRRFINVNSAAVYGQASQVPTPETAPIAPTNPYGLYKALGESLVMQSARVFEFEAISVRLTNLYGRYASALFGIFLKQWLAREPLSVTGNGRQRRDFTYVGDVASALINLLESDISNEVLNVGTGKTEEVLSLARLFNTEIEFIERALDEPLVIQADISRLRDLAPDFVPTSTIGQVVPNLLNEIQQQKD